MFAIFICVASATASNHLWSTWLVGSDVSSSMLPFALWQGTISPDTYEPIDAIRCRGRHCKFIINMPRSPLSFIIYRCLLKMFF